MGQLFAYSMTSEDEVAREIGHWNEACSSLSHYMSVPADYGKEESPLLYVTVSGSVVFWEKERI
jgi:hypothetical protein